MSRLTASQRREMAPGEFALPGGRFPIEDRGHAQAALFDLPRAKGLTPGQKATVRRKAEAKLHGGEPEVPWGRLDA